MHDLIQILGVRPNDAKGLALPPHYMTTTVMHVTETKILKLHTAHEQVTVCFTLTICRLWFVSIYMY